MAATAASRITGCGAGVSSRRTVARRPLPRLGAALLLLGDGELRKFLGFNMVVSERLAVSSNVRTTFAFTRSGLHLGIWKEMSTRIDNRQDLTSQPWQLYSMISAGACRTQLGKIVQINCADTTGGDITF